MDKIPNKIKEIIERYISQLRENNISIDNAYLFGSYATGKNREWSDIDIAIVSKSFEGNRIKDKDKIRRITLSVSSSLEILPFNPSDFSLENPLAKEIMETGIRLV
jgi:predicted nucleotidyltransferase